MNSFPKLDVSGAPWRKSSYSQNGNDTCVEVAPVRRMIAVRDSKNPNLEVLAFSRADWGRFTEGVRQL